MKCPECKVKCEETILITSDIHYPPFIKAYKCPKCGKYYKQVLGEAVELEVY